MTDPSRGDGDEDGLIWLDSSKSLFKYSYLSLFLCSNSKVMMLISPIGHFIFIINLAELDLECDKNEKSYARKNRGRMKQKGEGEMVETCVSYFL